MVGRKKAHPIVSECKALIRNYGINATADGMDITSQSLYRFLNTTNPHLEFVERVLKFFKITRQIGYDK